MFRRRRAKPGKQSSRGSDEGHSGQPGTEIVGISTDPRHNVTSGGAGLYEFWTAGGVPVYLHDTTLISMELRPRDRRFVVRFDYSDPQWTPPAASQTPIIVMEFEEVTILEWIQDSDGGEDAPADVNGQVSDFAHFSPNAFQLTTYQSDIRFTAGKLTVTLLPRES
jgi:hypothetical protein